MEKNLLEELNVILLKKYMTIAKNKIYDLIKELPENMEIEI